MASSCRRLAAVVNPVAGRARGAALCRQALTELGSHGEFPVFWSERPGHATELARKAVQDGFETVVAIGGDGTFREVATSLAGSTCALGLVPTGSGNDLCRTLGISEDVRLASRVALNGRLRPMDVAEMEMVAEGFSEKLCFVNAAGFGFDATVVAEAMQVKGLRGLPLYLVAVFRALMRLECPEVKLETTSGSVWSQSVLLVAVANGRFYGGGMRIAPDAEPDDGQLDICVIDRANRFRVLTCLQRFINGSHGILPEVRFLRCATMELSTEQPLPMQVDGDLLPSVPAPVTCRISVRRHALQVRVP
ncbi:MAG: diacylglycerol kinase family protein [candidate division WOR-3 bacterium]